MKRYDEAYFRRWYHDPDSPLDPDSLRRNVSLAVAAAESVLDRTLTSVLDVGCGEGRWQPILAELRPEADYLGLDPSAYAVESYGEERGLRQASFLELEDQGFDEPFDLVVCSDVLHYLDSRTLLQGLDILADLVGGVALLEVFTAEDPPHGDREGFHEREAIWYRRAFRDAGLEPLGLQLWIHEEIAEALDALDLPHVTQTSPDPSGGDSRQH